MASFAGVEAWAGDRLEPDTYLMQFTTVERTKSANDNEQVQVDLRVVSGPYKGAEQRDWITFSEPALGRIVRLLNAIEEAVPEKEFKNYGAMADWLAEVLKKGPKCNVVIRLEPGRKDPSKEWPKVADYRKPDPSDLDNDASGFASGPKVGGGDSAKDKLPF